MVDELLNNLKPIEAQKGVRIRYNGNFVKMSNGRSIWNTIQDAKVSIRFEFFENVRHRLINLEYDQYQKEKESVFQEMFNKVEFVEL